MTMRSATLLLFLLSLPALAPAKDHSHNITRAQYAAEHGEPARAKYILRQILRKDPRDQAVKDALEALIHPPKATATPTAVPKPKAVPTPKAVKPAPKPKASVKAEPKPTKVATAVPAKAPKAKASKNAAVAPSPEAPKLWFYQRLTAKIKSWLPKRKETAPALPAAPIKKAQLPCKRVTYVYFGKTRTDGLIKELPQTSELLVHYNKGKLKISRDQVIKMESCG